MPNSAGCRRFPRKPFGNTARRQRLRGLVDELLERGYKVNLVHMTVDPDEAFRRMISRFLETGRLIGSDFFKGVGTKPRDTYNVLKREGRIAQAVEIDANGDAYETEAILRLMRDRLARNAPPSNAEEKDKTE